MSLKTAINEVLKYGDTLAEAWRYLQAQAKRVSYPAYESACIAAIAAKYNVTLNEDGTIPKAESAAYQRLKRLRRAHPDFKAGVSNKSSVAVPRTTRAAFQAHVLSLGLTKAQLRVLFKDTLDGLK